MVFHVKPFVKTLLNKGFLPFMLMLFLVSSCITPRHTVEINDYILLPNGKQVLGREQGLTAFIFENNQRKMPFAQYVADKYKVGNYTDVAYWVTVDGHKLKVMVYENAELEKYFDTSMFMVSTVEPDANIVGSKANFIAISVINSTNDDCLADGSLYQNITIQYLRELKNEYVTN